MNTLGHHLDELRQLHQEMPMVLVDRKVELPNSSGEYRRLERLKAPGGVTLDLQQ